jgi:CheY-specific phosphatase CheX
MANEEVTLRLRDLVGRYLERCVPQLFATTDLEVVPIRIETNTVADASGYDLAGIVGFVGDISGTVLLGTNSALLSASHPMRAGGAPSVSMQLDWIGELANQLTGRLRNRLSSHGIRFEVSPPIALMGERMHHVAGSGYTHRAVFRSSDGAVFVSVDADMTQDVATNQQFFVDPPDDEGPEGQVTLF